MRLDQGAKIGSFVVTEFIGKGGMGEVYKARDVKLGRDVAIKMLPKDLATDHVRLEYFEQEAKTLAKINHPNVAALYDFVEDKDVTYIVMQYIEGETLEECLRRHPLKLKEAAELFMQVAEGLEAAHELGILHRDLKPSNIMITPAGKAILLDFGLAKALEPLAWSGSKDGDTIPMVMLSQAEENVEKSTRVVGTPAYMAPERLEGKQADKRADAWSFGCCLFKAIAGTHPFGDSGDRIDAILQDDPNWRALPKDTPPVVMHLLERTLEKNVRQRLGDLGEAIYLLRAYRSGSQFLPFDKSYQRKPRSLPALALMAAAILGAGYFLTSWQRGSLGGVETTGGGTVTRSLIPLADVTLATNPRSIALSPSSDRIVFVGEQKGARNLYVRDAGDLEVRQIPGTADAWGPFISPDGEWAGFFAGGKLKKVSLSGGLPVTLLEDVPGGIGGTWSENNEILFNRTVLGPLHMISALGGESRAVTELKAGEIIHWYPRFLPGGEHALIGVAENTYNNPHIQIWSRETGERWTVLEDAYDAHYMAPGYLVYARLGALYAQPFNLETQTVTGSPRPIVEGLRMDLAGRLGLYSVSPQGTLVYARQLGGEHRERLVWVTPTGDRSPRVTPVGAPVGSYNFPRISSDGRFVALRTATGFTRYRFISLYDLERRFFERLTPEPGAAVGPVWGPNGDRLVFSTDIHGLDRMFVHSLDESSEVTALNVTNETSQWPASWSADGRYILYVELGMETREDIWLYDIEEAQPRPVLTTPFAEYNPVFVGNGDWIAYVSEEQGQAEVYLRSLEGNRRPMQVSRGGGKEAVWSSATNRLYFRAGTALQYVEIHSQAGEPQASDARELFEFDTPRSWDKSARYDVAPDGERFLMIEGVGAADPLDELVLVSSWPREVADRGRR